MIKAKKLVALMLAFLMIFGSFSVLASAMADTVDGGTALNISTKFFKEVDGTWVETTKVEANDTVKARVYLGTDYYAGDSTLLFFYDKDFFTHSYSGKLALEMNSDASGFAAVNGVTGSLVSNANLQNQVSYGYISADQLADYGVLAVNLAIKDGNTVMFDGSDWLFEFTLTVAADASGEGDLFTVEELYQNTTRTEAYGDVPKGEQGGIGAEAWSMWVWDADFNFESQPVSTISSITFNANGGTFADGNDTFGPVEGTINTAIADGVLPAEPTYAGYTFLGWVDAAIEEPTESDIVAAPATYPEDDLVLNAYWIKNVNITFKDTGDTTIDPITNVTPNTEFKDIADPKKAGYTFVGWNVRGGELPEVYPTVDTTYTAIWATNVTVSFNTNGADAIAPVDGYEGAPFETVINDPKKEGHYFVGWVVEGKGELVDLPTVFPATDVTYEAIFDTYTYYVMYYVKNVNTGETTPYYLQAEYGAEIGFPKVQVPEGYAMDSQWYTDADCTVPFVAGTTMGTAPVTLYTTIDIVPYKAYFLLEEGDDLADAYAVVDAEYLEPIEIPAPPSKEGFVFAGWTPYVGILDKEEDAVFYATWEEEVHNVVYYLNDGTEAVFETYDVPFNYDLEVPAAPVREGYTFIGWNTDAAATEAIDLVGAKMPNGDLAYYAIWEINEYTVTFDSNEGTAVEDKTQAYKSSVTAPEEPTREGYKFVAWKDADDNAVTFPFEMPAHDVALKAEWKLESYTLKFAETGDSTIGDKIVSYGDTIEAVEDPVKAGYKFLAWSPEVPTEIKDLGNDGDTITYTAQWKQEEYTLKFVDTGDVTIEDKVVKMGDTVSVPAELTKEGAGYYFTGWDNPVPTTIADMGNDGDEFTYTALWEKESYTLKFADTNDAGDVITEVVTFGDSFTAPTGLTKTGHVFAGWDETPPTTIGDMGANKAEITYTAQWTKETYIFQFTNTGDTTVVDATVTYGDTYEAPSGLTKTGYIHTGWDPVVPTTITDLGENEQKFTFAATWDAKVINVTFDGNNGLVDGVATKVVPTEFDSDIVAPAAARDGYAFVGWSTDKNATVGTTELGKLTTETPATYYAIWSADSKNYTVEFYYMNVDGTDYVLADDETKTLAGVVDQAVPQYVPGEVTGFTFNAGMSTVDGTVPATGELVLKVYYDRNKYNLTYEGNAPVEVYFGTAAADMPAAVTEPTKVGNYFTGWEALPATMPADDVAIAAKWTVETYVFKFADTGDMTLDDETVTYGGKFTAPTDLTKTGYVFEGWDPTVPTDITDLGDNGDEFIYTAQWREETYVFRFTNLYGNTVADATVTYGGTYTAPTGLVRVGFTHTGWDPTVPTAITEDLGEDGEVFEFAAKWSRNSHTLLIDNDNGSEIETLTRPFEAQISEPAAPSKTGYDFSHWINSADGTTVTFPFSMPDEDVSIKAVYTEKTYVLKFADTGDQVIADMPVKFGDTVTVPAELTKDGEGVYFTGWDKPVPTKIEDMGASGSEFTYTAQWAEETYKISFTETGDTAVEDMTVTYGQTITLPTGLTKEGQGLYFTGEFKDAQGNALTATIGDLGVNNASVSYAAQWDKESYTLTFTNLFGNTVADIPVTYGDTIAVPDGLTRTGYTFTGWDPALEAAIGDLGNNGETISYAAKWDAKVINVTFDGNNGTIEGNATKVVPTTFDQPIVAPTAARDGYAFVGWSTDKNATVGTTELGKLTTETPATYYAIWSADSKNYTVEFYYMNVDGTDYVLADDETKTLAGVVDQAVPTYVPGEVTGFTFNAGMSTVDGTVPATGELVLKVYYDRNKYNLTYEGNAPVEVYFGTAAADMPAAVKEPTKEGHFFVSWAELPATMPADDVTITANWTVETYNIIFADTNDAGDEIKETVSFGGAITAPTGLVKTGHVFAGWSPEVPAIASDLGDNGDTITYTAQWTKETYTLTFTNLFGNTVDDIPVTYGETITVPTGLTRTGYTFDGWDPALEATIGDLGADKATVSYAAKWTAKTIDVTFDANNGTIDGAATKVVPTTFDQPIVAPKAERDGYTFAGWSTDKNATVGTNNLGNLTTETPDTYYAIWSADGAKYTVEFYEMDLDGVNYTLVGSDNTLEGVVDQPVDTYVPAAKTGFTVNYDKSELDGTVPATGTLVLKVYYDRASYKLTYKGAGSDHASYDVLYGTPVAQWPVPDTAPERTGYYFDKWNASSEATMPAKDVAITAAWNKESYTITFDTVGGSPVDDITAAYGDPIVIPDDPTKAGNVFEGWSDEILDVMPDYGDNGEVITITATWRAETYTLKFAETGDTAIADKPVTFGDKIEAITGLTKVGHVFAGWDETPPTEITDLGDDGAVITYTAQWTKETYTLIFADTNDAGESITKVVTFGEKIAAPTDLKKTGHVFAGWDETPPTDIIDMGEDKATFTYTAQWTAETYIFHFTNTGDAPVADATVTYGDTFKAPQGLTKTGYTHSGWDPAVPTAITDLGEDKQEFTFAATWDPKTINVTFDGNNGLVDGEATKVVPTLFDADIVAPAAARDGYAFVGWSTDKNATVGTTELGKLTTETPATYYAIWSADSKSYTVEFWYMNVDGTDYVKADAETKTLAGVVDQAVPTYVPDEVTGFTFNAGMSTVDGTVPSTGELTLKVYYDRDKFTVTYEGNEPVEVYFGAEIPAAVKEPAKVGNYFVKWNNALTEMPADDLVITAEWATESYKLTFGDLYGNVVDDIVVKYGDTITVPTGLTREGYVFDGWSPELTETIGDLGNNGDTVTYTAKWSLDQFTITIKLDGGNIDGDTADVVITKNFGEAVSFTDKPVKEGYTFVDWSVTIPETMPAEDMTITAIWQLNTYTIDFDVDGGTDVADITAPYGTPITAPAAPTKAGHVFAGWSDEIPETMPDYGANGASKVIKATWTPETYTLKFAETGDTTIADKTVTYGDTIEAITGLTKVGHVFAGWDVTPPTEIGDLGANGAVITYTAQWTKETYTLIFADTNDAGDSITKVVTYGETIEVPADLTKTGHSFDGWDVTPPTEIGDLGADKAVLTYTAQWTKNSYKVTWIDEAGSKEETVVYGDAITAPTAAAKEGYYFVMWTPEVPATMPAENLTFTALYEVGVYNVNYYVNGSFVSGYTAEFGEVIRTENTGYTTPVGYVFDGWYTDKACTVKVADGATVGAEVVNLYAKVTAGSFTANFWLDEEKTELYYTSEVVFDTEIKLPADLAAPTKEGYVFAGWDPYVGLMDEEGKEFVAVWYANDVITATFYVDGEVYEMFDNLTFGGEMEIPAPPVKAGHRFDGWALKGTTDIVDLQGTTVPAESVEYEAIFTITEFTVTYYNYAASEFGPAGTPAPIYEAYTIDGAAVENAYNLGEAIAHPAAPVVVVLKNGTEHTEYYTFKHWEDADGNVWADGAAMPANDVALYAKYDRVGVQLAVIEGTTGVIEKAHATDMEQWYVYGFTGRRFNAAEVPNYFEVKGDGSMVIENSELSGLFGTGAKVLVYDRLTNELVEEFYVIYFGDVNGDGRVNVSDSSSLAEEIASPKWSNRRNPAYTPYLIKAADLNGDKRINISDASLLSGVLSKAMTINQETGLAS